jgi:hypothetical protein
MCPGTAQPYVRLRSDAWTASVVGAVPPSHIRDVPAPVAWFTSGPGVVRVLTHDGHLYWLRDGVIARLPL